MVDVVQVPIYPEIPWLLYFVIGWIMIIIVGLAIFLLFFFKKDFREITSKVSRIETNLNKVNTSVSHVGGWIKKFSTIEPKLSKMENYLANEVAKEMEVQLRGHVDDIRQYVDVQMDKRTGDLARFFLFSIFEDVSSEENPSIVEKRLSDLRLFVKFNKNKGYWSDELQNTVDEFLIDMEKRWKDKDAEISALYSEEMDKHAKNNKE
jgi:hypothetical protein